MGSTVIVFYVIGAVLVLTIALVLIMILWRGMIQKLLGFIFQVLKIGLSHLGILVFIRESVTISLKI